MINYESVRIGDLGKVVTGKTPKTDNPENFGSDHMFIGPTDLHKHFFISSSERMVSTKGLESIKGSVLNGVSVLVGCIGWDMGNVAIVEGKCVTNQQINSITNIHDKYNPLYIYYWLKNKKDFLFQQASVTRTPILNKTDFSNIAVNVPKERKYQNLVVDLLSTIDKKIELNNHINAELEAMAKTLYDYWFVQFDFPDANGKPYKASGGKMVYNDTLKREVPQDWKVNKLVEITSLIRRGISPKYTEESGTQVLNQKCIRNQKISFEDSRRHQAIMDDNDERLLKPFDVLVNSTGVGTLGRVAYVKRLAEKKTTVDSHVSIVRANPDKVCPRYLAWKLMRYQPVIEAAANGSTGQVELSKSFLEDLDVIIPSGSVAKKFSEFVEPIAISVAKRESENEQLISLRDWLLPMLMNGQVTVKPSTEAQEAQHG